MQKSVFISFFFFSPLLFRSFALLRLPWRLKYFLIGPTIVRNLFYFYSFFFAIFCVCLLFGRFFFLGSMLPSVHRTAQTQTAIIALRFNVILFRMVICALFKNPFTWDRFICWFAFCMRCPALNICSMPKSEWWRRCDGDKPGIQVNFAFEQVNVRAYFIIDWLLMHLCVTF